MSNRKHLTPSEVERLLEVTLHGKNPERDYCLIYMCFIHGCRASEIGGWRLSDIDLEGGNIYVHRLKNGFPRCIRFICEKGNVCGVGWINAGNTVGPIRNGYFFPIGAGVCRANVFTACFVITVRWRNWRLTPIRICCGMVADLRWRTEVSIPD